MDSRGDVPPTATSEGTAMTTRPSAEPSDAAGHDVTAADRRAARARRERLLHALLELEEALTAPASRERWLPDVAAAVASMRETILDHVAESEAPDGLLAQIAEVSSWLGPRVAALRAEHDHLVAAADALAADCAGATTPDAVAEDAWALLETVSRHRRRGADLLYDAYSLDVSASD
jgi:hypothetical protein